MKGSIDISRLIDERAMSATQWLVAACCALSMLIGGYAIQVMALTVPQLSSEFGVEPSKLGLALSAVSFGLGLAAALVAPLGDRIGRRMLVTGGLLLLGISTFGSATATSPAQFVFWRVLTGFSIGAGVPNCNAWTSEYLPSRGRATLLVIMNSSVGIGAYSAGLILPTILGPWGWRGTFVVCGIAAVLLAAVTFVVAPESLKFLISRRPKDPRITSILKRIAPDVDATQLAAPDPSQRPQRPSVTELLGPVLRKRTLVLWAVVFGNLFTMYFLLSWMTVLLQSAGWPYDQAVRSAVLVQLGGVGGGLLLSVFINRGYTLPALFVAFVTASICLALFRVVPSGTAWLAMILLIGCGINGGQLALNALSTAYYPPAIKATGMAWVGFVGTMGSIIAPNVGSRIIEHGFSTTSILSALSIPPLICLAGVLMMRREWQNN